MSPFLEEAREIFDEMRDIRRDIHRHPEVGMQEVRTSGMVAEYLKDLGLEVRTGIGGTGVTGTLHTREAGPTVSLRADMDALPVQDQKSVPYASIHPGIAHACGHDGHTAMLLGAAHLLTRFAASLEGNVKFIFQPSEDQAPGGALGMIRDGALKNPRVDGIFSLHLRPDYPEGMVVVKPAYTTISSAGFVLRMIGKGGHVAFPHQTVDPIVMAGMVIMATQTILSRRVDPCEPSIVAFGSVQGGTANNIIPDEVTLTGTIRTLKPEARQNLARLLEETAQGVALASAGECRLAVEMEYPAVFNHPGMLEKFKKSAVRIADADRVREARHPMMGGEDVAYFHQQVPGVQWYLGTANPAKGFIHSLHNARFDFNEAVMPLGAAIHAQSAVDFLAEPPVS